MPSETAVFGGGCFWCIEAVFQRVTGVQSVESGYMGGHVADPTYQQVCTGRTGHAEVVRITFDPSQVSYHELLDIFFAVHDPTTLNRQGNDIGTQYRSVIFYASEQEKREAEQALVELSRSNRYNDPLVTALEPAGEFYPAEDYHKDYYAQHGSAPYCQFVIAPKLQKFDKLFGNKRKAS